jgi:hypothetical protein
VQRLGGRARRLILWSFLVSAAAGLGTVLALAGWVDGPRTITVGEGTPDIESARRFDEYPLYWVGDHFERWDLESVEVNAVGSNAQGRREEYSVFRYGSCEIPLPADGGCGLPLEIQIRPFCARPDDVATGRHIRGAPLNFSYAGDAVLYTDRVRINVYSNGARGRDLRALRALRSVNNVPPALDVEDPIPPPNRDARGACPRS